jgi:hypothetical protein
MIGTNQATETLVLVDIIVGDGNRRRNLKMKFSTKNPKFTFCSILTPSF